VRRYLEDPPSAEEISAVLKMMGAAPRGLMRTKEAEYRAQGLGEAGLADAALVAAMAATPKLIERPVVIHRGRAALGRPPENVLALG
jgi:arsenate reductase